MFHKRKFTPNNPNKYGGDPTNIIMRSSWETRFAMWCDTNPSVLQWASEPLRIPYINPATNKHTTYVPDFLIIYENKAKEKICELIEIKPSGQTSIHMAGKSKINKVHAIINEAKWKAAALWAKNNNINFRILTENELFKNNKNK